MHNGKLFEMFEVDWYKTGVHSITINFYRGDRLDNETIKQGLDGIQWTFTKQLDDLDFADDICLL